MKTKIVFFASVLVAFSSVAATRSDSIRAKLLNPTNEEVLVTVHRGDWRNYAENSLEGIDNAIKMGADIIEIDLQRTADGKLVLMHDRTINRSTTGKGKVKELTLDSIRRVYLRSGVGERTSYRVPTLEEALNLMKGRVLINLDKAFDYFDQVYEIIERTGTTSQIIMKSGASAKDVKEKYGKYLDKVIYMPVVNLDKKDGMDKIKEHISILNPPAFELVYADTANTLIYEATKLLKGKSRIWYNSLWSTLCGGHDDFASLKDPQEGFGFLIDTLGATMIQTDQPAYLLGYLYDRKNKKLYPDEKLYKRYNKVFKDKERAKSEKQDWAKFYRYEGKNDSLTKAPYVVFIGNSITDAWARKRGDFFTKHNIAGRGISGQTSSHMLVRFQSDVIDLKPKAVVILAGTNDIARNNGIISLEHVFQNIVSMCQLAKVNGIQPIIASILPSAGYTWRPSVQPAEDIKKLNTMLWDYAKKNKFAYVDYYSQLVDERGGLPKSLSHDDCHPNADCYEIMEKIVLKTISKYLK